MGWGASTRWQRFALRLSERAASLSRYFQISSRPISTGLRVSPRSTGARVAQSLHHLPDGTRRTGRNPRSRWCWSSCKVRHPGSDRTGFDCTRRASPIARQVARVEELSPSAAAAPFGPPMRQRVLSSRRRMCSRSATARVRRDAAMGIAPSSVSILSLSPVVTLSRAGQSSFRGIRVSLRRKTAGQVRRLGLPVERVRLRSLRELRDCASFAQNASLAVGAASHRSCTC